MKSRFVSAAESEFADAASFYEDAEPGLGEEFVFSILGHVDLLTKHPNLGREVDSGIRTITIKRFPYSLIYVVEGDEIVLFAVAHQSRRPFYWRERL